MKNENSQIDVRWTATEGMCMRRNNTTMNSRWQGRLQLMISQYGQLSKVPNRNVDYLIACKQINPSASKVTRSPSTFPS